MLKNLLAFAAITATGLCAYAQDSDNSDATYNPVMWSGSEVLSGWNSPVEISLDNFNAGDRIGFVFETETGGAFKASMVASDGKVTPMTSYSSYPGYSQESNSVALSQNGAVAAYINEADAANFGNSLQIIGDGLTLIKVLYFPAGTSTFIYVTGGPEDLGAWMLADARAVEGQFGVHSFSSAKLSEFKFSTIKTTDWLEFNTRAFSAGDCEIGENALGIYPSDFNNKMPWPGDYDVTIDLCAMTLTLATDTPEPEHEYLEIYLRGSMNGWGTDPAYLFTSEDNVIYTLSGVNINASEQFKFATSDWSTVNLGGVTNMVVNTLYQLQAVDGNCSVAESITNATITLNINDKSVILSSTSGVENIEAITSEAEFYNIQGVRVANPTNGIYLKRVGDKVVKVIVK